MRPDDAINLAKGIREIYLEAELILLQKIAKTLSGGLDSPAWAEEKLLQTGAVLAATEKIINRLEHKTAQQLLAILSGAYRLGADSAIKELKARRLIGGLGGVAPSPGVLALVTATLGGQAQAFQIRRSVIDAYQEIITQATAQAVAGVLTIREASKSLLLGLAKTGITSFTDRSGRSWEMGAYAEMSVRTASMNAYLQGTVDQITDFGEDLVIISNAPEECRLCRPYEHRVLSISGNSPERTSLEEARNRGLFHPNCRHSMSLYIPGVTKRTSHTADPEGAALRQKQRAFERRVRELKRQVAIADGFGEPEAATARSKLRAKQAEFKQWRDINDRKNLSYRTNVNYR
ncbi:phage minor capsid protein [Acaricomes phytoseiuli]|uniref:phage minor capsid protein n=1 Tax=Acaricomes phytoseiuli TaxID=291968 RepID=UPI000371EDC6|nr:phage minor capsid protein [Acaricomes phytoseiuli]